MLFTINAVAIDVQTLLQESRCLACPGMSQVDQLKLALYERRAASEFTIPVLDISLSSVVASIQLSWTDTDPQPQYEVWRMIEGGSYTLRATVGVLSYTDTEGMGANAVWFFKVRAVGAITFSNEVAVSNNLRFDGSSVTSISYPTLILDVGTSGITISHNASLQTVSLPLLEQALVWVIIDNAALVSVDMHSFVTATSLLGASTCHTNPLLTTLNLSSMIDAGAADFDVHNNASLTTILMSPAFVFDVSSEYFFSDCAYTIEFELFILQRFQASPVNNFIVFLNGGTNAPNDGTLDAVIAILEAPPYDGGIITN